MAKFRIDSIADLSRQLAFSPHETRLAQVASAEELLHSIDPAKAYPLEFVVFRITGYHPKQIAKDLLTGLALQHDLGLLIEQISETLNVQTISLAEPVLSIDDVTEKFNVTSKTIQRWRRKGLPARRFIFPDAKRRVGFLLSSVERFFSNHREQVSRGSNFSQVTPEEREEIIRRGRRLATAGRCCEREISRRVGRWMNRSPLTILHTIRKHDEEAPAQAIFPLAAAEIGEAEREKVLKAYRRGMGLWTLARRMHRPRAEIYRAVIEERVAKLARRKVRFIDDPLYRGPEAAGAVEMIASQDELDAFANGSRGKMEESRVPRDLPPNLQALCHTPLLTPSRERAMFLKFNFHKFQFVSARRKLDPQFARHRDLQVLESYGRQATDTKNAIVRANLRLVVSIARKHLRANLSLMELISDGNLTLMRAVESFDTHKGNRFSTYATLALMKGFARSVPLMAVGGRAAGKSAGRFTTSDARILAGVPDARPSIASDQLMAREEVTQLLSRLDDRERSVVLAYYGLGGEGTATYEQVARRLGLSKQRVRQIEQLAIAKLRAAAS